MNVPGGHYKPPRWEACLFSGHVVAATSSVDPSVSLTPVASRPARPQRPILLALDQEGVSRHPLKRHLGIRRRT
jgi:hypothetical protein